MVFFDVEGRYRILAGWRAERGVVSWLQGNQPFWVIRLASQNKNGLHEEQCCEAGYPEEGVHEDSFLGRLRPAHPSKKGAD